MCPFNPTTFSIISKYPEYENGFVIDLKGNIVPLVSPKLVIDYTTDLDINELEICFIDDFIFIN
jgi:hypothetical protein